MVTFICFILFIFLLISRNKCNNIKERYNLHNYILFFYILINILFLSRVTKNIFIFDSDTLASESFICVTQILIKLALFCHFY
jgi:hypothetical protein